MFIASKNAKLKIAHYDTCFYAKRISSENKLCYYHTDEALRNGCVLCQHCSPIKEKYIKRKTDIDNLCKKFNVKLELEHGIIYVDDNMTTWQIIYSSEKKKLLLYHQNTSTKFENEEISIIEGYHLQKSFRLCVVDVMEYIVDHFQSYINNTKIAGALRNKVNKIAFGEAYRKKRKNKSKDERRNKRKNKHEEAMNVLSLIASLKSEV